MWKFEIIDNWDEVWSSSNLHKWKNLFDATVNSNVFFHPSLVKAWTDTYRQLRKLTPIFIWGNSSDGNIAFFPLVLWEKNWKNFWIRSIVPVGYSDFDYHDPLFYNECDNCSLFWDELITSLRVYKADIIEVTGIHKWNIQDEIQWKKEDICPFFNLSFVQDPRDILSTLKTKLRGDLRRQQRRLNELGRLHLVEYKSWDEAKVTFDDFIESHTLKWPNAYKAPLFHENLLKLGLKDRILHFSSLNIDNLSIAWHLGFEYKGTYYYYMPSGRLEYSNYSPVKVHLLFLMQRALDLKYSVFDHLRGEENYKMGWADGSNHVYQTRILSGRNISQIKYLFCSIKKELLKR